jgi:hypothetical protein
MNNKKPPMPMQVKMPGMSVGQMPGSFVTPTLNPEAFQHLLSSQGIRMVHSRPLPSPLCTDVRGSDLKLNDPESENGFYYYNPKEFVGAIMGNTLDRKNNVNGVWDMDQAAVIIPTEYSNGEVMDVNSYDRIELPDHTVRYYQRVEHSRTGVDKLHFRVKYVDCLLSSSKEQFLAGTDFVVDSRGYLQWLPGANRPKFDAATNRGEIYSVSYYTSPVLTVISLPHQLRTAQTAGPGGPGTPNVTGRFPQLAVVRKDFIPADPADRVGQSNAAEPQDGSSRTPGQDW